MDGDLRLAGLVSESLTRFAEPRPTGRGVSSALRAGLVGVAGLAVERVALAGGEWDPTDGGTWARRLDVALRLDKAAGLVEVAVPWLVDDRARSEAPPGITVGGHEGLVVAGRARIPVQRLVRRRGVHLVQTAGPAPGPRLAIEAGPLGRCLVRGPGRELVQVAATGVFRSSDGGRGRWRQFRWAGTPRPDDERPDLTAFLLEATQAHGLAWAVPVDELDETTAAVLGAPRPGAGSPWLTAEDVVALMSRLREAHRAAGPGILAPGARVELDDGLWRQVTYGDDLTRAAFLAAGQVARDLGSSPAVPDVVQLLLGRRLREAFREVATGAGPYRGGVVARRSRNLVDLVEQHRTIRFLGPDGLEPLSGRMDLRTIPSGWRNQLCPVHTPESKDVGLVRHVAIGLGTPAGPAAMRYADLSVAAALVPFVGHDDPTRVSIVAKMFGQALQVDGRGAPGVRTGIEDVVAEQAGVVRAPQAGLVVAVATDHVILGDRTVWFGPAGAEEGRDAWMRCVEEGDFVGPGEVLAHAPDVVVGADGAASLALGLDAIVAFVPWQGWNYEDGIVVSESFVRRTTSEHTVSIEAPFGRDEESGDVVHEMLLDPDAGELAAGTPLFAVTGAGARRVYRLPEPGTPLPAQHGSPFTHVELVPAADGRMVLRLRYRAHRPLCVGDKLTTRHGGKGVVTLVLRDSDMPRLPDGTPVEVLLNPLGVLRRLNVGTMFELGVGLARHLAGDAAARIAPRALGAAGRAALRDELDRLGAAGGRLPLTLADGSAVGPAEGALVGVLHLLKLDHLARSKAASRDTAGPSRLSLQPVRSTQWREHGRAGAPQRLGEMEVWALQALGAQLTLADLMHDRGEGANRLRGSHLISPGVRSAAAHLAVAGIGLSASLPDGPQQVAEDPGIDARDVTGFRAAWIGSGEPDERLGDLGTLVDRADSARVAAAKAVLRALELEPGVTEQGARAVAAQTVRWFLRLAVPVPHPWSGRDGALPDLEILRLPPAALLGAEDDPLRVALTKVVELDLTVGKAPPDAVAEVADRLRDAVRELLGGASEPASRSVLRLPDGCSVLDRLTGKRGLLRRNGLGSSAVRSARLVLTGDPERPVHTIGLPQSVLDDLGVPALPIGHQDVVLLNRSPTLHPYSIVALRAEPADGLTARVHPYLLRAIAGDFDGDTVAVHRPATEPARAELWQRAGLAANTRTAASGGLLAKLDLDVALGWHLRSGGQMNLAEAAAMLLGTDPTETELGRVAGLMRTGWQEAGAWGFSVVDLPGLDEATTGLDALLARDHLAVRRIREAYLAGVGGKEADLTQLLITRGEIIDPNPLHEGSSIDGRYLDGLADEDYFAAAQQAVGALAAKKLVTPHAGALTRSLVRLGQDCVLVVGDCGSAADVRTPLSCQADRLEHVCQACYGPDPATGHPMEPGRRIGVLAGMLIGEQSTQLAMKSIHERRRGAQLGARVAELSGIFGAGSFVLHEPEASGEGVALGEDGRSIRFGAYAAEVDGWLPPEAFGPLLAEFHERLNGVEHVHAEVLLRMLAVRDEDGAWHYRLRREVDQVRGPLSRALWDGAVSPLIVALDGDEESPDLLVQDVVLGGAR